jgi:HSP20 family protein
MYIAKYDPFREIRGLQDEVNRLFSSTLPSVSGRDEAINGAWYPKVDIYENKENLVLEAELPGMTRDDFELSFENNVLTLRGERKFEKEDEGENYHRVERAYGSFTRSFTLPQTVTVDGVTAEFNNGVLRVALPKREETKARKIEITGGDAGMKTIETAKTAGS